MLMSTISCMPHPRRRFRTQTRSRPTLFAIACRPARLHPTMFPKIISSPTVSSTPNSNPSSNRASSSNNTTSTHCRRQTSATRRRNLGHGATGPIPSAWKTAPFRLAATARRLPHLLETTTVCRRCRPITSSTHRRHWMPSIASSRRRQLQARRCRPTHGSLLSSATTRQAAAALRIAPMTAPSRGARQRHGPRRYRRLWASLSIKTWR